jgi:hypothetical protein
MGKRDFARPKKRLRLKSEFVELGCSTVAQISEELGFSKSALHSIFSGWRFPGKQLQESMCKKLGISKERLEQLL